MSYFIALLIDSLMRDNVDPVKVSINTGLSIALILKINPNEVDYFTFFEGTVVYTSLGILLLIRVLFLIWMFGNMFILLIKIHIHCPKSIKKYSTLSLFGGILIGPVLLISTLIPYPFPGQIYIIQSVGFIFFSIGFFLKEDLAFVLPFKAIRLAVIKTDSAVCLFGFKWIQDTKILDDLLFSAMLQAVSNFMDESLDKGQIEEIRLPEAVLMIQRNIKTQIACVLVTTKSSQLLRNSLKLFLDRFISQYSFTNPENIAQYSSATQIVKEVFPFLPDYE